jgi:hypothetical protein
MITVPAGAVDTTGTLYNYTTPKDLQTGITLVVVGKYLPDLKKLSIETWPAAVHKYPSIIGTSLPRMGFDQRYNGCAILMQDSTAKWFDLEKVKRHIPKHRLIKTGDSVPAVMGALTALECFRDPNTSNPQVLVFANPNNFQALFNAIKSIARVGILIHKFPTGQIMRLPTRMRIIDTYLDDWTNPRDENYRTYLTTRNVKT